MLLKYNICNLSCEISKVLQASIYVSFNKKINCYSNKVVIIYCVRPNATASGSLRH